jgi:hypothetical protein
MAAAASSTTCARFVACCWESDSKENANVEGTGSALGAAQEDNRAVSHYSAMPKMTFVGAHYDRFRAVSGHC